MFNTFLPLLKNTAFFSITGPKQPSIKVLDLLENNKIHVRINSPNDFHGPEKVIQAFLYESKTEKLVRSDETRKSTWDVEFSDLSYLTSYRVEVCAATISNKSSISFTIP